VDIKRGTIKMEYALYKGQLYPMYIDYLDYNQKEKIYLYSWIHKPGLQAVNDDGETIYKREVSEDDLDFAYRVKHLVDYKGQTFEILSDIGKRLLGPGKIYLYTENREDADKYGFEPYDKLSFKKPITIWEVDRITEIKIPILRFKDMAPTKTIIEKHQIIDYINNLVE